MALYDNSSTLRTARPQRMVIVSMALTLCKVNSRLHSPMPSHHVTTAHNAAVIWVKAALVISHCRQVSYAPVAKCKVNRMRLVIMTVIWAQNMSQNSLRLTIRIILVSTDYCSTLILVVHNEKMTSLNSPFDALVFPNGIYYCKTSCVSWLRERLILNLVYSLICQLLAENVAFSYSSSKTIEFSIHVSQVESQLVRVFHLCVYIHFYNT